MTPTQHAARVLVTIVCSPIIVLVGLVIIIAAFVIPVAVLVKPGIMDEEVRQ